MEDLKKIIVYFIKHFSRPLTRTELVKLIYLFEYNNMRTFGKQYSGVKFIRDHYGPMDIQIIDACEELHSCGAIIMSGYYTSYGSKGYSHRLADDTNLDQYDLPVNYAPIADDIINVTCSMNLQQILDYTYATPPMTKALGLEQGKKLLGREIDMKKNDATIFKATKEQLASARTERHKRPSKGTKEEYNAHLLGIYNEYEDLRRKANLCLKS
jgi:hypothetical protein